MVLLCFSLSLRFRRVRRAHNIPFRFLPLKERVGSRGGESLDLFGNGSLCSAALTRETDCLLRLQEARRPPPSTAQTLDVLCRDAAVCFSCVCFNFFPLEGKKRYLCYVFFPNDRNVVINDSSSFLFPLHCRTQERDGRRLHETLQRR